MVRGVYMKRLKIGVTPLAAWVALVKDAERASGEKLDEQLESYLVFLLQRFASKPDIALAVFALDYLDSHGQQGALQQEQLRDVGDKCLLFSGLFPERATRRHVTVSYFIDMGQNAYHALAGLQQKHVVYAQLFKALEQHFVRLMDTLQCMRELAGEGAGITPLLAEEIFHHTNSRHAREILKRYTDALPVAGKNNTKYIH